MLETFTRILQAWSHLCRISQLLHWPPDSEPLQPSIIIQPLLPVWVQTSLNIDPSHMLFFLLSPFHWCSLKLQIRGQLMPSIPLSWPFLNPPFLSHPLQVVTVSPNIYRYNLYTWVPLYFLHLQVSPFLLLSPDTHLPFTILWVPHYCIQIISSPAFYKKKKFPWGSYHLTIPSLSPWSLSPLSHFR